MENGKLYELHCKGQFEALHEENAAIKAALAELLAELKGDADKPGLCERVRNLEKVYRRIWTGVALVVSTVVIQFIAQVAIWLARRAG